MDGVCRFEAVEYVCSTLFECLPLAFGILLAFLGIRLGIGFLKNLLLWS